jgi:hypothetical protein
MAPTNRRDFFLCLAVCTLLLALVFAEPRPIDDLFIALAGGRDVVAGHLGTPDAWSYTTEGRVWFNQNWASDVLFYAAHVAAGPTGLLVLKAVLLGLGTLLLAASARLRGAGWPEALLVAALTFAASRSYIDLRPSLVGLVLTSSLLAVLTRAVTRPAWLTLAVAVVAVWANAHGSFVFGLALLALWTLAIGIAKPGVLLAGIGALAAALALAAFANPFGLANLTHPFVVGTSFQWRTVAEWTPLFTSEVTAFGSRWEFCTIAAVFVVLVLGRFAASRREPAAARAPNDPRVARGLAFFDVTTLGVVAAMAVQARRFVPLALVVLAAPLATQLSWWQRRLASPWPVRLIAVGLAGAVAVAAPPVARRYAADNPVFAGLSTFERMVDAPTFPRGAAEFLRANDIRGRAYAAWESEGFLHWTETPVTVLIGGRAQQVYDEAILQLHKDLRTGTASAPEVLTTYRVGLAILPLTALYSIPLGQLVYDEGSPWVYLYCDGRHVVLADSTHPDLAAAMAAREAGTLVYPSPAIAATSRMMYLASPKAGAELDVIRAAAEEAAKIAPTALAYAVIGDIALADHASSQEIRDYLASERERLAGLVTSQGNSLALAQARLALARTEATLVARTVDPEGVQRTRHELELRQESMRAFLTKWAYGWDPNLF